MKWSWRVALLLIAGALAVPLAVAAEDAPAVPGSDQPTRPVDEPVARQAGGQVDRLELDSSAVTGNQELPRVLYIVPWKESGIGELQGKPVNSLLDEVLAPIDRDVFQRQVRYFEQIYENEPLAAADD